MLFNMPQKMVPKLQFKLYGSLIEQVNEFKFWGLIFDSNLSWKAHLTAVANKVSRIIGILHKLKHFFPSYILVMMYNSLILPLFNYSLLAWGSECHKVENITEKGNKGCEI